MPEYKPEPEKWHIEKDTHDEGCYSIWYAEDSHTDIELLCSIPNHSLAQFILRACQSHGDMLEALKGLMAVMRAPGVLEDIDQRQECLPQLNKADTAIAKAEGRA